ncbi:MAG TPA: alpha/beta fold hydrolase [Tepidisphaeraceae bacterium]|nr:alpha/beta fold hydrolase [Tepidisphaeraceae bacterium]
MTVSKMFTSLIPALVVLVLIAAAPAFGQAPAAPAAPETPAWDAAFFKYERTTPLVVEETTPTAAQVDWKARPARLPADLPAPRATAGPVKPYDLEGLRVTRLRFRNLDGVDVPVLLTRPAQGAGPFPVVVALHGLGSNKAQVTAQVAPALAKRGFAVLAPDLPLHGERPGEARAMFDKSDLRAFVARARQAVRDTRLCIDLAESRPDLDTKAGVVLVGYSMGAIFNAIAGPADPRVKAMCLMVGGTPAFPPLFANVPNLAALQPQLALPHFAGPLLMLNATQDHIITREMTQRMFDAAAQPKQLKWYESGHLLPKQAYDEAAQWVAEQWKVVSKKA